jgi:hypothetical protein
VGGDKELIDRLLAEYKGPEEIIGLLTQLLKAMVERASQAELTRYLYYDQPFPGQNNRRKRRNSKGLKSEPGGGPAGGVRGAARPAGKFRVESGTQRGDSICSL